MFKKGQKFGVYKVKGLLDGPWGFSRALSEDPFFKSDVILNTLSIDSYSEEQITALGQRLDHLFLLEHAAIVPVYDTGYEGAHFYFTTNYYAADSFHQTISQGLTLKQVFDIVISLAQALEYAAEKGFYHSSLSPENLIVDDNGRVGIINFGVSYSFAWASSEEGPVDDIVAGNISDLGKLLKTLLSASFSLNDGGGEDCISQLEAIIESCQSDTEEHYVSYQSFITDLSALNFCDPEEEVVEETTVRAMQQMSDPDLISEQQRAQLLPHLRELVGARNRVQEDLDEIRQEHQETQKELKEALQKVEQLTQRVRRLTKYDSTQGRKKAFAWLFCGVVFGSVLMFMLLPGLLTKPLSEATASVSPAREEKALPVPDIEPVVKENELVTVHKDQADNEKGLEKVVIEEVSVVGNRFTEEVDEKDNLTVMIPGALIEKQQQASLDSDIKKALTVWSESWARQETDYYFDCYATEFIPPGGRTRTEWVSFRSSRIRRPDWIEVGISDIQVTRQGSNGALVEFIQHYCSDSYEDRTRKVLTMKLERERWKIVKERSISL